MILLFLTLKADNQAEKATKYTFIALIEISTLYFFNLALCFFTPHSTLIIKH